jgi:hypothetical protein
LAAGTVAALVVATVGLVLGPAAGTPTTFAGTAAPTSGSFSAQAAGARTLAGTGSPGARGDGSSAVGAELDAPSGIAEDPAGDLFIADTGNCRVQEIRARSGHSFGIFMPAGALVTVVGGSCRGSKASPAPSAVALDASGDLFIAFSSADRVEELPAVSGSPFGSNVSVGKLVNVAGTGAPGFTGDGGSAVTSTLDDPSGLAVDADSDLLIADTANCRLRMVAATDGTRFGVTISQGHIYTVAGNGTCGSAGDGGPSSDAELWDPGALAVDPGGDVFVADQGNRTIRVLAAHNGTFFGVALAADDLGTVAGEGSYGPYLVDGLSALGETAEINFPVGIALDSMGDLYIADGSMHTIRFVAAGATSLRGHPAAADDMYTAAGALSSGSLDNRSTWIQTRMIDPAGLAMTPNGQLIFSDSGANVVRELPAGS